MREGVILSMKSQNIRRRLKSSIFSIRCIKEVTIIGKRDYIHKKYYFIEFNDNVVYLPEWMTNKEYWYAFTSSRFKVQGCKPFAHYDIDVNLMSIGCNNLTLFKLKFQRGTMNPEPLNGYEYCNSCLIYQLVYEIIY